MDLQIIDEKSLIKKYQNEIRSLKEELDQLKRGFVTVPRLKDIADEDIVLLKQKVHSYSYHAFVFGLLLGSSPQSYQSVVCYFNPINQAFISWVSQLLVS